MKRLILFTVTLLAIQLQGQTTFQKVYSRNSNQGFCGKQTSDNGFVIAGYDILSGTDYDFYLVKTDANGDTLWSRAYGGNGDEEAYAVEQTNDGGYIIAGVDSSSRIGDYNIYLVRTNSGGDTLWTRSYGGTNHDFAQSVKQTADGGFIISGYTNSFGAGDDDGYLIKTDGNGNVSWSKTYGGINSDFFYSVKQTSDGGYITSGCTGSFNPNVNILYNDVYVVKTDASGNVQWNKTYGRSGDDQSFAIIQTLDGGYAITGHTNVDSASLYSSLYIIKTDASGDTLWTRSLEGNNFDKGLDIKQLPDGTYFICGSTYSFGHGSSDAFLVRLSANGAILSEHAYGGNANEFAYGLSVMANKAVSLFGYSASFGSDDAFLLATVDSAGNTTNTCIESAASFTLTRGIGKVGNPTSSVSAPATVTEKNTRSHISSGTIVANTCSTTAVNPVKETGILFGIYPNPCNGNFNIRIPSSALGSDIIIYNMFGQIIYQANAINNISPVSLNAAGGMYFVSVQNQDGILYRARILKQ